MISRLRSIGSALALPEVTSRTYWRTSQAEMCTDAALGISVAWQE
jgi:hypothetical protein